MAKSKNRSASRAGRQAARSASTETSAQKAVGRRKTLKQFRNVALLAVAVGGGSLYIGSNVLAGIEEADLSRIGNGIPTIVQIHDPQCPTCRALQREARLALEQFEAGQLQYLVANIRKDEGRALADKHSVGHVTLLLLDGNGRRMEVITGLTKSPYLEAAFRRHLERATKG